MRLTTSQGVDYPEFYNQGNYERASQFLEWMANRIHTNEAYFNVGMLEVMNEPVHSGEYPSEAADMIANFYPQAYQRIRDAEDAINFADGDRLHIQFMVLTPLPLPPFCRGVVKDNVCVCVCVCADD